MKTIDQIRWVVILLTAWIAISTISAQEIRGVTLREDGSPVPYVGVVLRTTADSTLIAGTYSDEEGRFLLTPSGDYPEGVPLSLYCSAIGYESRTLPVTLSDEPIRIVLREQSETLSETVVFGSRIKRSAAGYVAQVSDDLITKGVNIDKTLTFLPGITHNPTGYYLNGMPIAQFYIDDRKASVSELETIPGSMVQSIEVSFIDRTGVEKTGSVVHIRLKAPETGGYYGNVRTQAIARGKYFDGVYPGAILNLRKGKTEVYANVSGFYGYDTNKQRDDTDWTSGKYLHTITTQKGKDAGMNSELNVNYNFTDEHRLGAVISASYGKWDLRSEEVNSSSDKAHEYDASTTGDSHRTIWQGRLKYSYTPKSNKFDIQTWAEILSRDRDMSKRYSAPSRIGSGDEDLHQDTKMWELVATSSQRWSDRLSSDIALVLKGSREQILSQSTLHRRQEASTAALVQNPYLMAGVSYDLEQLSLSGRLSYQGSFVTYEDRESEVVSHHNTQGPEVNVSSSYYFSPKRESGLTLSYAHKVYTFNYGMINSTKTWQDRYHYYMGNPNIKAPTDDDIRLSGNYRNLVNAWIGYSVETNPVTVGTFIDPDHPELSYTTPVNGETERWWNYGLQASYRPASWWQTRLNLNGGIGRQWGEITPGEKISVLSKRLWIDWNHNISLPRDWSLFAMLYCEPTYRTYNQEYVAVYGFDTSVTKRITPAIEVSLYASYGNLRILHTYLTDAVQTYENLIPHPYVSLTFRWSFRKGRDVSVRREYTTQRYQGWQPR